MKLGLSRKHLSSADYQRKRRERLKAMRLCLFCLGPNNRNTYACDECSRVQSIKKAAA